MYSRAAAAGVPSIPLSELKRGMSCAFWLLRCLSLLIPVAAFSQAGNGTITGTITDPTGAAVAGASVEVNEYRHRIGNTDGIHGTGAYTATNLSAWRLFGFCIRPPVSRSTRARGLRLAAAQVLGIDVPLEVGGTNDPITVTAEASLLKTESGDVAHNITIEQLQDLPVLGYRRRQRRQFRRAQSVQLHGDDSRRCL